jgi:hypothetical protein
VKTDNFVGSDLHGNSKVGFVFLRARIVADLA